MSIDKDKEYIYDGVQDPYVELVLKYKNSGTVLDLGSGSGRDALFLAQNGFDVTAVDNDPIHLARLQSRAKENGVTIHTIGSDLKIYEIDTKYDVVISDMVLHFFDQETIIMMVKDIHNATADGGINVVIAYSDKNPASKRPYLFKEHELEQMYDGWNILRYEEKPTEWFKLPGETELRRNHAVYLIAQN